MALVNFTDRLSVLVADENIPNRNFLALGVLVWFRSFAENAPPWLRRRD
jgi:hypothetical protein